MSKTMQLTINGQVLHLSEKQALDLELSLSEARRVPGFSAMRTSFQGDVKAVLVSTEGKAADRSDVELTDC